MAGDTFLHYSFKIWLKTKKEPLVFPVAEAAWGRLKRALAEQREGFFICATTNGLTLAINLAYVQMAQLMQETWSVEAEVRGKRSQAVKVYLAGSTPESFQVQNPTDLANIFITVKSSTCKDVLSFTALDGSQITFFTEDLILFETSTIFLEEGFSQLYEDRTGRKPPTMKDSMAAKSG